MLRASNILIFNHREVHKLSFLSHGSLYLATITIVRVIWDYFWHRILSLVYYPVLLVSSFAGDQFCYLLVISLSSSFPMAILHSVKRRGQKLKAKGGNDKVLLGLAFGWSAFDWCYATIAFAPYAFLSFFSFGDISKKITTALLLIWRHQINFLRKKDLVTQSNKTTKRLGYYNRLLHFHKFFSRSGLYVFTDIYATIEMKFMHLSSVIWIWITWQRSGRKMQYNFWTNQLNFNRLSYFDYMGA